MADRYLKWQDDVLAELKGIRSDLRRLMDYEGVAAETDPTCPHCDSTDLEDTSTMDGPLSTCRGCGKSFAPEENANG